MEYCRVKTCGEKAIWGYDGKGKIACSQYHGKLYTRKQINKHSDNKICLRCGDKVDKNSEAWFDNGIHEETGIYFCREHMWEEDPRDYENRQLVKNECK